MQTLEEVKAFASLYAGAPDRYGIYNWINGKNDLNEYDSIRKPLTLDLIDKHLKGEISLATVLINKDNKCKSGAIDFDDHKKGGIKKEFDYDLLQKKIEFFNLPLNIIKSKTGGAHAWLFLDQHYPAKWIRHKLKKFAYQLVGHTNIEMFPKQNKIGDFGSLLNLPYYKGNSRQLIDLDGNPLNLKEMLKIAPSRVRKYEDLKPFDLIAKKEFPEGRNNRAFSATSFLKKHYPDDWEERVVEYNKIFFDDHADGALTDKELQQTVISSNERKDYHEQLKEEVPTELVGYDVSDYMARTDITEPEFLVQDLIIEGSTNFTFGEKGKGKTEYILGLINALARGKDFMQFGIDKEWPCAFFDFEMHPHDPIKRIIPYLEKYGSHPKKDYLHIIHWNDQKNRNFPDIAEPEGQNLILKYLQKIESLTGKKPFVVLDNLRSASGYKENDADSWRPIGLWLKELSHGLNYTLNVVDHSGKSVELEMRGTSSKADWANVCLQILPEKRQGSSMKIKVKYAKARGLRPDQTDPFVCQYDLNGNWSLTASDREQEDEALKEELKKLLQKNLSQKAMAKELDISVGKVNKLIKEIEKRENY